MPTKQTESAPSFLQVYTQVRRDRMKHSFLRQISACVDWRGIRTLLNKKYTKTQNATGNPAYDALMMFKILLLQTWYGLSDYEVEERINDSLLFSEFLLLYGSSSSRPQYHLSLPCRTDPLGDYGQAPSRAE